MFESIANGLDCLQDNDPLSVGTASKCVCLIFKSCNIRGTSTLEDRAGKIVPEEWLQSVEHRKRAYSSKQ
jgi:hypothetical protein